MVELWNAFIVNPLINGLILLYDFLFRDFGLAIVILTVGLRFILFPLFVTQIKSQRAMQELGPALQELKKKYKDDRQRFAEEQMRLYRERGVNPASGCLPLLLQMPILIGLYSALAQVGCGLGRFAPPDCPGLTYQELQSVLYPFVPNPIPPGEVHLDTRAAWLPWITAGLAVAEPIPWKVLAVLAGATQLVASLMTMPAKPPPTEDPMQKSMQAMVWYFPAFTVFIAWSLPSGLALYWVVTTVFSIVQQWYVTGWGKLGKYLPALETALPAPARHALPASIVVNPRPEEPKPEEQREQRRRRKRRR